MIHALALPLAAAGLLSGPGSPDAFLAVAHSGMQSGRTGYATTTTCPALYIEGQPFVVTVAVTTTGEASAEVPVWMLTSAAWQMESNALERREAEGVLPLQPGQSISTSINLEPAIAAKLAEDKRDFRIDYSPAAKNSTDVIYLSQPESGIDFMTLPKEQLGNYQVVLQTTGGPVWIELWPEVAPAHARNFLDLCSSGFYDGSPFHRVIPGFMIQGGKAKDGSSPPRKQDQEFSTRRHTRGVLSAARLTDVNSATSEFFITHQPQPQLDGKYSAFGEVITGMDAVDRIVDSVAVHYALMSAFARLRVSIDARSKAVETAISQPNPPQEIQQALVVKATKSRPVAPR